MATTTNDALSIKAKLFRGFADRSRLSIVQALRDGALTVGELVQRARVSRADQDRLQRGQEENKRT